MASLLQITAGHRATKIIQLDIASIYGNFLRRMIGDGDVRSVPIGVGIDGREGLVLFFAVGGQPFGVRLTDVTHIEAFRESGAALEEHGQTIREVTSQDGSIRAVDLHEYLGLAVAVAHDLHILIVFKEGDARYGLVADEVQSIRPAHQAPELPWPRLLAGEWEKIYGGFFNLGGSLVPALNPDYIFEHASGGTPVRGGA